MTRTNRVSLGNTEQKAKRFYSALRTHLLPDTHLLKRGLSPIMNNSGLLRNK